MSDCQGFRSGLAGKGRKARGGRDVWPPKGSMRDPCEDGTVLYLGCTHINILVEILYYGFYLIVLLEDIASYNCM